MKYFISYIIVTLFFCTLYGQPASKEKKFPSNYIPPKPIGWTSDFAHVFNPGEVKVLDQLITKHEAQTSNEIAIVTLSIDSTVVKSLEQFEELSLALFNKWGIGKKGKNNGVAIIFAPALRRIRIEVGYGLEMKLMDKEAKEIIDKSIVPFFKMGKYYEGVVSGLNEVFKEIK